MRMRHGCAARVSARLGGHALLQLTGVNLWCNPHLTVRQRSILFNRLARVWPRLSGCYLEGVPDLGRGLLGNNGGGLTGAMDWRFAVYLQLSINFVG